MNSIESNIWAEIDLGEQNHDPGGGILYALRYEASDLIAHQSRITSLLQQAGGEVSEAEDGIQVDLSNVQDMERFAILFEELVVINDALSYADDGEGGVRPMSIEQFVNVLKGAFYAGLVQNRPNMPESYDFVDRDIPMIVKNILTAHEQNNVLTEKQLIAIQDLGEFAAYQATKLNRGGNIAIRVIHANLN